MLRSTLFLLFLFLVVQIHGQETFTNQGNTAYTELGLEQLSLSKTSDNYLQWETELQGIVSSFLGIPEEQVYIVSVLPYTRAQLVICSGNIASFLNAIQQNSTDFENTMLEGSTVIDVLWDYPCENEYEFEFSQTLDTNGSDKYSSILDMLGINSSELSSDYTLSDLYNSPSSQASSFMPVLSLAFLFVTLST